MTKTAIFFKIQDGGRPPFWKSLNRHISVKNRPILMKFTLHHILNPITVTWAKIEIFNIQDGNGRRFKIDFLAITHRPIVWCQRKFVWGSKTVCKRGLHDKNCIFLNPRWRTAAILKIVKSPYLSQKSSDVDELWYTTSDIKPDYSHVTKNWNLKNSRWRRPPSLKSIFWR